MNVFDINVYQGCRVLITGGLGFIGSNLALKLAEVPDVEIIIIDALVPEQGGNHFNIGKIRNKVQVQIGDIADAYITNHLVSGVDYIFNIAGSVSHIDSMIYPQMDLQMNCTSHIALLEACKNFNPHVKIVFTSTRQVYGKPLYLPIDEDHRTFPLDVNGINKLAAEYYHLLYHKIYGTRAVCLRLTNTYGPRQLLKHNRQGVIAWFIRQAIDNETIELFGDGRQRRDLNYVDDVVDAILMAGASEAAEGEIYNLGGNEVISLVKLAEKIIGITEKGKVLGVPFPADRQLIDIGSVFSSHKKINNQLGWSPKIGLGEGLKRTIDFYSENREHYWQ